MKTKKTVVRKFSVFLCGAVVTVVASANDGFYQGAGSSLMLVNNPYLRVKEESLIISPIKTPGCYQILVNGEPLLDEFTTPFIHLENEKVELGALTECRQLTTFSPRWRAEVEYTVTAFRDQNDVLIGFPVPYWESEFITSDGRDGVEAPGVVNFKTYIDGSPIYPLEVKLLKDDLNLNKSRRYKKNGLPGFTWRVSFKAGKSYKLRTEYDFGASWTNGFYSGLEYLKGELPWFKNTENQDQDRQRDAAETIYYFLTPINSWAPPPPKKIKITVKIPEEIPITRIVPRELKPTCVRSHEVHYKLMNTRPLHELQLSLPDTKYFGENAESFEPLRTFAQWQRWKTTLGGKQVKIGCDVIQQVKAGAAPDLATHLNATQCVASCGR